MPSKLNSFLCLALLVTCPSVGWAQQLPLAEPSANRQEPSANQQGPSAPHQEPSAKQEPSADHQKPSAVSPETSPVPVATPGKVVVPGLQPSSRFLAEIDVDSPTAVRQALERAEKLFIEGEIPPDASPAALVLQGPEVAIFLRENYRQHKAIVDLAARLTAFEVVRIQVCQTQLDKLLAERPLDLEMAVLQPFVTRVPSGNTEIKRLVEEEGYIYF